MFIDKILENILVFSTIFAKLTLLWKICGFEAEVEKVRFVTDIETFVWYISKLYIYIFYIFFLYIIFIHFIYYIYIFLYIIFICFFIYYIYLYIFFYFSYYQTFIINIYIYCCGYQKIHNNLCFPETFFTNIGEE